ncbi:MAG TPA: hypothetical protein PK743_08820 [Luteimonas sp.]|nr:hypothetical protein [Luteimonas sp.]
MGHTWKEDRAKKRIQARFEEVREVEIIDYKREMSLQDIPTRKAYRMDAAQLYVDIVNVDEILACTVVEGETCHKRTLRFFNQHYRAVHRILQKTDAIRVDFHNQRLHAVVPKPYGEDNERARVTRSVAIAQLISDVLAETGEGDEQIPNAKVRVGIDTGRALAVNNGRKGGREPLFLGRPANHAAKCAGAGTTTGIYLTNAARSTMGFPTLTNDKERTTALTADQIQVCTDEAELDVSKDEIIKLWREEQEESPIGSISFGRPTPPLSDLDFTLLSAANSKRFEGVSVYADIDSFTAYVDQHLDSNPEDLVRTLHVVRSELDAVIHRDFGGRRVRFVGDCVHGLLLEGTAHTTDEEDTVSTTALCSGALRSSFACALSHLESEDVDTDDLGLAIGFELGPLSVTRLGMKGDKLRCATGRAVLRSEAEQRRCSGIETAIGADAYAKASDPVRRVFSDSRKVSNFDYDSAVQELAVSGDRVAKAIQEETYRAVTPAIVPSLSEPLRPHTAS